MIPLWAQGLIVLAVLGGAAAGGAKFGADRVQAKWDQQVRDDKDAADAAREVDRLRARTADADYQTAKAAAARRATTTSPEVRNALNAPICRPLGASAPGLRLGDVSVPAAVVGRLRDAGADY